MRQSFLKFGRRLVDPDSCVGLVTPKTMKVKHDYKVKSKLDIPQLDKLMSEKRSRTMTERFANLRCALCGSNTDVEVHHLRSVKDIRAKIRTGNSSYEQWTGGFIRKQVPLCRYHHKLLHKGKLSALDFRTLSK